MLETIFVGRIAFDPVHDAVNKCFRISVSEKRGDKYINMELTKFYKDELPDIFKLLTKGQIIYASFNPEPQGWIDKQTNAVRTKLIGVINKLEIQFPPKVTEPGI